MSAYRAGALLVLVATTFFAVNGIVARIAMDGGLPPVSVAAVRTVGGAIFLLPFVVIVWRRFTRPMLLPILGYAAIGIFASQALYFQTLSYLDVALALVLSYLAPIPIAIYQHVRRGEKLPTYAYVVMIVAIAGVALSVLAGSGGSSMRWAMGLSGRLPPVPSRRRVTTPRIRRGPSGAATWSPTARSMPSGSA